MNPNYHIAYVVIMTYGIIFHTCLKIKSNIGNQRDFEYDQKTPGDNTCAFIYNSEISGNLYVVVLNPVESVYRKMVLTDYIMNI